MASIKILEKDYTKSDVYSATDTIVFIPGMIGFDENGNSYNLNVFQIDELKSMVNKMKKIKK